jgi:hypothetical protein
MLDKYFREEHSFGKRKFRDIHSLSILIEPRSFVVESDFLEKFRI